MGLANVCTKRGMLWAKGICTKYHVGHKTKADGKKYYIAPVYINQMGVEDWKFEEEMIERIIAAPTLVDAIMEADIVPKSVGDCTALRREAKKRKRNPPKYSMDTFNRPAEDLTLPILLWGDSDCGKTQYAKS